jgi:hypothetical protein
MVYYCIHKVPPRVPILSQIILVMSPFYFLRSILILSYHLRLDLPSGSFPQVSPSKPSMHLTMCYVPFCLSVSFFIWPTEYVLSSTDH